MRRFKVAIGELATARLRAMISDESYREDDAAKRDYSGDNAAMAAASAAEKRVARDLPNGWWQLLCDAIAEWLQGLDPFGSKRRRRRARAHDDFRVAVRSSNDPEVNAEMNRRRQAAYHQEEQVGLAKSNFSWLLLFAFLGIILTIVNILLTHI